MPGVADITCLQEFMILPVGAKSFREALQIGCEASSSAVQLSACTHCCPHQVYHSLKGCIKKKYGQALSRDSFSFGSSAERRPARMPATSEMRQSSCFSHVRRVLGANIKTMCSHSGWFCAFSPGQQRGRTGIASSAQTCNSACVEALDVLMDAIEKSGHKDKVQCCFRFFVRDRCVCV